MTAKKPTPAKPVKAGRPGHAIPGEDAGADMRPPKIRARQAIPEPVADNTMDDAPPSPIEGVEFDEAGNVEEFNGVQRGKRRPFGRARAKLSYDKRDGFHRHWFNDVPGRLEDALAAGYAHVIGEHDGQKVCRTVGQHPQGGPLKAYLMETPMDWHVADLAAEQQIVDELDEAIRTGGVTPEGEAGSLAGQEGRYIPKDRPIRITTTTRGRAPTTQR